MIKQMLKISLISILGLVCVDASAAPIVKKLGGGAVYKGTDSAITAKTVSSDDMAGANVARSGRSTGAIKPATVGKSVATPNTSRLSLGKYLHNAGVTTGAIKKVSEMAGGTGTGTGSAGVAVDVDAINTSITSLNGRVDAVETGLNNAVANVNESLGGMQDDLDVVLEHVEDTNVHVTAEDKAAWDAKQDALTAGTGISIENGVISADISEQGNVELELADTDAATGKMVSGIGIADNTVTVTRSNVRIPVGGENANPTAAIWIQ